MSPNAWRALVSALADDNARDIYARIVLNQPIEPALDMLSTGKRRRVIDTLHTAGLVSFDGEAWRVEPDVFQRPSPPHLR